MGYARVGSNPTGVDGVLAQSEACVLSKDEVLGSKPRYSRRPARRYSIGAVPRLVAPVAPVRFRVVASLSSRLAQLVERKTLNLVVVGSSPTVGVSTEPMAQRQRVGFQTRRLGVRIPLGSRSLLVFISFSSSASGTGKNPLARKCVRGLAWL